MKNQILKSADAIAHIETKLVSNKWLKLSVEEISEGLINLYYLVREYKAKNRLELATTIYNWESEYREYKTKSEINEMLNTLYADILEN